MCSQNFQRKELAALSDCMTPFSNVDTITLGDREESENTLGVRPF